MSVTYTDTNIKKLFQYILVLQKVMSQSWSSSEIDSYNIWNSMFPCSELHQPAKRRIALFELQRIEKDCYSDF